MNEFLILMRLDMAPEAKPSPEQMQVYMQQYRDWVATIAAKNQFNGGTGLSTEGKVIRGTMVTDGPFVEAKETLGGFIVVLAKTMEEALAFAMDCPILKGEGNSVEVRQIAGTHNKDSAANPG